MKPRAEPTGSESAGLVLFLALAVLWFASAAVLPWFESDEGRYAEIPREMAASGDWVTPRLDGLKYFEKPPLQYWATALAYRAFGVTQWSARLWALSLAFLCLPLTYLWVARYHGRAAGLTAAAVLAMSPFFVVLGHLNLLDSGFTFWMTATVFSFLLAQESSSPSHNFFISLSSTLNLTPNSTHTHPHSLTPHSLRGMGTQRGWILIAWVCAAFAVLSKGIVVIVLAGLTLTLYSLLQRDWSPWRRLEVLWGLPLFLLIAAPWFVAVQMRNPEFSRFFFLYEHFARFLTTVHQRVEPWWFFLPLAAIAFLPWIADLPRALAPQGTLGTPRTPRFDASRFLLIYSAVVLVFFSISQSKLPPYILPMLPPIAALIGIHAGEAVRSLRRAAWLWGALVAIVAWGLVLYVRQRFSAAPSDMQIWAIAASCLALLGIAGTYLPRSFSRQVLYASGAAILGWQVLLMEHAAGPMDRSAHDLLVAVRPHLNGQTRLYALYQYRQTVAPYLKRTVTVVGYRGELEFGMSQEPGKNTQPLETFLRDWNLSDNAIAFIEPDRFAELRKQGMPGTVIGEDSMSVALSRR
jgi:4-amino-4-deoxy-L-arabinose transferase-like glycosyltransferase